MKSTLAIVALSIAAAGAFTAPSSQRRSTALNGGFLEGRGKPITIRDDEDGAMWFDDGTGGRVASEKPKKPEPKKPEPKKKSGGFKFPWDN